MWTVVIGGSLLIVATVCVPFLPARQRSDFSIVSDAASSQAHKILYASIPVGLLVDLIYVVTTGRQWRLRWLAILYSAVQVMFESLTACLSVTVSALIIDLANNSVSLAADSAYKISSLNIMLLVFIQFMDFSGKQIFGSKNSERVIADSLNVGPLSDPVNRRAYKKTRQMTSC